MKRKILTVCIGLLFGVFNVNAQLIATDFQTAGDHRSTLNTVSGKEWLDLDFTQGQNKAQVVSRMTTGDLQGWRVPTVNELVNILGEIFPIAKAANSFFAGTIWQNSSVAEAANFRSLFAENRGNPTYQYGMFETSANVFGLSGSYYSGLFAPINFVAGQYTSNANAGWWLVNDGGLTYSSLKNPNLNINNPNAPINQVSQSITSVTSVPEPPALWLFGFGIFCLGLKHKFS